MPGVIIPRKTVNELRKLLDEVTGNVEIALSDTRIQFRADQVLLTSKLIDGTFPEYERVIPRGNDKVLRVGKKDFADAVARVAAISAERSRPVKLTLARDLLVLSASSPEQGTASEELDGGRVTYDSGPLEIGFQARYLNDITDQIGESGGVPFRRRRRADRGAGRGGCERVVRADADAGVMAKRLALSRRCAAADGRPVARGCISDFDDTCQTRSATPAGINRPRTRPLQPHDRQIQRRQKRRTVLLGKRFRSAR